MRFVKKSKRKECRNSQGVDQKEKENRFKNRVKIRIVTWNINGIKRKNKIEKEWEYLKKYDVIILSETWLEEKDLGWFRKKLDEKTYNWEFLAAERGKKGEGHEEGC